VATESSFGRMDGFMMGQHYLPNTLGYILIPVNSNIQQMGAHTDTGWEWDLKWRRHLFDSEVSMAGSFLGEVAGIQVQINCRDDWVWLSHQYSAKSAYDMLRGDIVQGDDVVDFVELWKLRIPTRIAVFVWRLLRDRLPTKVNLCRRQVAINESSCPFCGSAEEDAAHFFFHCSKILPLWWESIVFPQHPRHHFAQHMTAGVEGIRATRWRSWWAALTWLYGS